MLEQGVQDEEEHYLGRPSLSDRVKSVPEHCSGISAENPMTLICPYPECEEGTP